MNLGRWRNYVAFGVLMASTAMGIQLLWGLLFLYWSIDGFRTSNAFLLSSVSRSDDQVLFWLIQTAWVVFGIWIIAADIGQFML